jgi:hypothetical protein
MINKETVLECIKTPMEQYHQKMKRTIGGWKVLVHVTEILLAGKGVGNEEFPLVFLSVILWLISHQAFHMERSGESCYKLMPDLLLGSKNKIT